MRTLTERPVSEVKQKPCRNHTVGLLNETERPRTIVEAFLKSPAQLSVEYLACISRSVVCRMND